MEPINIYKKFNFSKGSMEINFNGITNDNIDTNKIDILLENFINNHRHNYMIENVSIIRTILKDYEEKSLNIFYQDDNGSEFVKYDNSNSIIYEVSRKENNNEYKYKMRYTNTNGIELNYRNPKFNCNDYKDFQSITEEINEIMKHIYYLKNVKAVSLDKNDKALIEIYKLFYNENPDFSSKNINIKIQAMMSILENFGISLDEDYGFSLCGKEKMPTSLFIQQKINKLYPLGEVKSLDDTIKIAKESKKIVKIVGDTIRETISNDQNEELKTISKVIFAEKYCLPSNSNVKEISEFTNRNINDVESSIKLVKRIETRINK